MTTVRIHWFGHREAFLAAAQARQPAIVEHDRPIAASTRFRGVCTTCGRPGEFTVGKLLGQPNLRECLRCTRCHLTTRQRLMLLALQAEVGACGKPPAGAVLEQSTRLYRAIHARWPRIVGSEFLGADHRGGQHYWWSTHWWRWRRSRHESITALSYADQSLDLMAHSDVLEHVYDTAGALRECARVLRPGGTMLFTVPFFVDRDASILRGRQLANGTIEHIEPPEYHGDGLTLGGIYTFHNFGWDLLDALRAAGFSRVEIGLCHASQHGFAAALPQAEWAWLTLPVLFRAVK